MAVKVSLLPLKKNHSKFCYDILIVDRKSAFYVARLDIKINHLKQNSIN